MKICDDVDWLPFNTTMSKANAEWQFQFLVNFGQFLQQCPMVPAITEIDHQHDEGYEQNQVKTYLMTSISLQNQVPSAIVNVVWHQRP